MISSGNVLSNFELTKDRPLKPIALWNAGNMQFQDG